MDSLRKRITQYIMLNMYLRYVHKFTHEGDEHTSPTLAAEKIGILIMHVNIKRQ